MPDGASSEERSDAAKALANEAFKAGDYKLAVQKYGVALKHAERAEDGQKKPGSLETNRTATVLCNRCVAQLSLGDVDAAFQDATAAVKAAPGWPKAHFRLGTVLMKKGAHMKAYASFKQGWHLDTSNVELTKACQQAHQAMMGLAQQDKVMSQEELFKMRSSKLEQAWKDKTEKQKELVAGGAPPLMAAAPGAPVAASSYREEALKRTAKMANPNLPEEIARREAALAEAEAERAAEEAARAAQVEAVPEAVPELEVVPEANVGEAAANVAASAAEPASAGVPSSSAQAAAAAFEYELVRCPGGAGQEEEEEEEEELVLTVQAPRVATMKELELSVGPDALELSALDPGLHAPLHLTLPATVDSERARAKFDKRARVLTVRLPILVGVVV